MQKLGQLQKMGYSGAILHEVAQAGSIEASIEMADALLAGTGADVKSINASYASIEKYAAQAGKYVTGGFYKGGVDAAQGVVKGLESQQANIEKQIAALAKGMEAVFKQVLGIRSPSRVMAELGVFTAEGLAQGMLSRPPWPVSLSRTSATTSTCPRTPWWMRTRWLRVRRCRTCPRSRSRR
jgi:hypothetical protein